MKIILVIFNAVFSNLLINKRKFKDIKRKLDLSMSVTNMNLIMAPNRLPETDPIVLNSPA